MRSFFFPEIIHSKNIYGLCQCLFYVEQLRLSMGKKKQQFKNYKLGNQWIVSLLQPFYLSLSLDSLSVFIFTVMTVGSFFVGRNLSTTIEIHSESDGCQWAVIANKKIERCHTCQRIYGTFSILYIYVMRCHQKNIA